MSFRGKLWIMVVSGAVAAYAVIGGLPLVGDVLSARAQQTANDPSAQLKIVESVLKHIQNDYVDVPDMSKVRLGALRGLANGLDPYSSYLTPEQVKAYEAGKNAIKPGIGAEFSQISGYLYVISTVKGSPAEKAGLRAGDVIEYIDNKATRDISLYDARQLLNGEPGTTVTLRVLRTAERPQTVKVVRGAYKVPPAESRVEAGKIGVVKVYSLEPGSAADIRSQVQTLSRQGVQKLVLDLRGVSSGTLAESVAVTNLFIRDGEIARVIGREGKVLANHSADAGKAIFDGHLAVLIDIGTAGPGEVVAAAVLERKRGEVIGEKSFGAGTEQSFFPLSSGGGYLLTVAKWASPSGKPFLGEDRASTGIKPSIEVKRPDTPEPIEVEDLVEQQEPGSPQAQPTPATKPQKVADDLQLKKALEVLGEKPAVLKAGA
jgi:carboxyl-terminal processing protease